MTPKIIKIKAENKIKKSENHLKIIWLIIHWHPKFHFISFRNRIFIQ